MGSKILWQKFVSAKEILGKKNWDKKIWSTKNFIQRISCPENWVSNSYHIASLDKGHQDKCRWDKCIPDNWHL